MIFSCCFSHLLQISELNSTKLFSYSPLPIWMANAIYKFRPHPHLVITNYTISTCKEKSSGTSVKTKNVKGCRDGSAKKQGCCMQKNASARILVYFINTISVYQPDSYLLTESWTGLLNIGAAILITVTKVIAPTPVWGPAMRGIIWHAAWCESDRNAWSSGPCIACHNSECTFTIVYIPLNRRENSNKTYIYGVRLLMYAITVLHLLQRHTVAECTLLCRK